MKLNLFTIFLLLFCSFLSSCGGSGAASSALPEATVSVSSGQVTLTFDSVTGATSYNIYMDTVTGVSMTSYTEVRSTTKTTFTWTGLTDETTYYFIVTSVVDDIERIIVSETSATPAVQLSGEVENATATAGNGFVQLSFTAYADAESYNIYMSETTGVSTSSYTEARSTTTSPFIWTGLTNGTTYYFIITAVVSDEEVAVSTEVSATPTSLSSTLTPPANVVTNAGDGAVLIRFDAVTDAESYNIYMDTSSGVTTSSYSEKRSIASVQYVWSGLLNDPSTYYFIVTAVDSSGESLASSEVSANPGADVNVFWALSTIDNTGDVGIYTSIAIDSSDNIHISYRDELNGYLKYATNSSGSWVASTIDSTELVGEYTSIAIDSSDNIHISYRDEENTSLKYATNSTGSWVASTIDSTWDVGSYTSIAIDSSDKAHISYYDATNTSLKYATNSSGSWTTTTVDSTEHGSFVGPYASVTIDSSDKAHISYYDVTNSSLKYATNSTGSWVASTIDTGGVGTYTSIAIDSSDKAHISYYDATNTSLKYATNSSGSWVASTIDSTGDDVGSYTSIAIDSSDKAHISYYDVISTSLGGLKYATNSTGSWVASTIDSTGLVGTYTSIAIDSSDKAHISYYDEENGYLKYASEF